MERRSWYRLGATPEGPQFDALLDFAVARRSHYPTFLLVQRGDQAPSKDAKELLAALAPWLVTTVEADHWPGTARAAERAQVSFFHLDRGAVSVLKHEGSLAAFVSPRLPEDLCIMAADKTAWLASSARTGTFLLQLSEEERIDALKALPWLSLESTPAPD